jgi:hypothetical protein
LYLLDSEKSRVYLSYYRLSWKKFLATPKTLDKKIRKNDQVTANFSLVKIVVVLKSYWLKIPLSVRKCQKLGLFSESKILRWKKASKNSRCVFYESNCIS